MKTFEEIQEIVDRIECDPFSINLQKTGNRWTIQASLFRKDLVTGEWGTGFGGRYYVSPESSEGEIVQKCLAACLAYAEHEVRESFTYKNKRVFNPHISIDALLEVCEKTEMRH